MESFDNSPQKPNNDTENQAENLENMIPEGWMHSFEIAKSTGRGRKYVQRHMQELTTQYPDSARLMKANKKGSTETIYYSPEIIKVFLEKISSEESPAPDGWLTNYKVSKMLSSEDNMVGETTVERFVEPFRISNPEWFGKYRDKQHKLYEYYHPELVDIISNHFNGRDKKEDGWLTPTEVSSKTKRDIKVIRKAVDKYRESNPSWFRNLLTLNGNTAEHYSPELVLKIKEELLEYELIPNEWKSLDSFAKHNHITPGKIKNMIARISELSEIVFVKYRNKTGLIVECLSPESQQKIIEVLNFNLEEEKDKLRNFAESINNGNTPEAEEFTKLLGLFGHENFLDILYKFHPQYKKIPVGEVKSIISDYLGDFLFESSGFRLDDIDQVGITFLEDQSFRNFLYEILKKDFVRYFSEKKRTYAEMSPENIFGEYFSKLKEKAGQISSDNLNNVLEQLETYYRELFTDFKKPENMVSGFGNGRSFPDFYQMINIKEIKDKKRLLIADEMGVGKSASAILSKESLGIETAIIVCPSNVIQTWVGYLSDRVSAEGKQEGYFKPDQCPKTLVVEEFSDIQKARQEKYDYILISQEKLNDKYTEIISQIDYQMLIVDEVHKLKNITSGVRSKNLMSLAKKIEEENGLTTLLSGTPVPNKVKDLALLLKLLYPKDFGHTDNSVLVKQIIYSDVLDIRGKLLQRMEMKNLSDSVEMPSLKENLVGIEMSDVEKNIYELLLDEDELGATDKLRILRQFLLNSDILDATPGIPSSKVETVKNELTKAFQTHDKVVMFVNGYIEGVIRGDNNIIDKLGIPNYVEIMTIHGEIDQEKRNQIQKDIKYSDKKILLLVSGQTADVGVDFSGADRVYFYNEPWTMAEEKQQLGRVYRPGLKNDLENTIFISKDTIEEGIHLYIQTKQRAIEKLLKGIPRTEIENRILEEDEKLEDPNLEVNPELARYYFSDWDKMMKIFSYVKEIGEKNFTEFLEKFGREYARCYLGLGSRSYQANASRISGSLIDLFINNNKQKDPLIIDLASGPEMLKRHIKDSLQNQVVSIDINQEHFKGEGENRVVGSFLSIPIKDESADFINMNFALHYTQFVPSKGKLERLQALTELNRVLKVGGRAIIGLIYSLDYKNEEKFKEILQKIGFEVDEDYTGDIKVGENFKSKIITIRKINSLSEAQKNLSTLIEGIGKDNLDGLKMSENKEGLRDSRKIVHEFKLGNKIHKIEFNDADQDVSEEEKEINNSGNILKEKFGGIEHIPKQEIIDNGFTRILIKDKYILFKKLRRGDGVVVVK